MDPRRRRAAERIGELSNRQLDLAAFWREASGVIVEVVPYYWSPCWYTLDPASLLITSHFHEGVSYFPEEWLTAEYAEDDAHQIIEVVRSDSGISTLHEATGGDPSGSPRWRANMEMGADQELLMRLRSGDGETWGALGLYREPDRPRFDSVDREFLHTVSPALARGAQRSLLFGEALDPDWPDGPGLVVVGPDGEKDSATETAAPWLELLPTQPGSRGLPTAVLAVAASARLGAGPLGGEARVRGRNGQWITLRAAPFVEGARVAVIIEPTRPVRIFEMLMSAHGLTGRERDVVELVLGGHPTAGIAAALHISPHTVQEHLKTVFDKMGVRSRRELVAQAFFTHYSPRFRDNEIRTEDGVPIRGNPSPAPASQSGDDPAGTPAAPRSS